MRTLSDFWVVCRKSGHRRFFVILTQRNANFAEINGEPLCALARPLLYHNTVEPLYIGPEESVLISEVSLFQGLKSTQTQYLGRKKLSCLERCPYFRGVLIEGFHCIPTAYLPILSCRGGTETLSERIHKHILP